MSYCASGYGEINFTHPLSSQERDRVIYCVESEFDTDFNTHYESMNLWPICERYSDTSVRECLDKLANTGLVRDGDIEYIGEDNALWRFHYKGNNFIEQDGRVVYD